MLLSEEDLSSPRITLQPAVPVMDAIDDLPPLASGETAAAYDRPPRTDYQRARRNGCRTLAWHDATAHTPRMLEIIRHAGKNISAIPRELISSGFSSCYSRLDGETPSVTITVNFVHPASNRCIHPACDRALTHERWGPPKGGTLAGRFVESPCSMRTYTRTMSWPPHPAHPMGPG